MSQARSRPEAAERLVVGSRSERPRLLALSAADLRAALPMSEAIEVAKLAYAALARGAATVPPRLALRASAARGTTLLMAADVAGVGLGAKLVSVFPGNKRLGKPSVSGLAVLLDPATGEPTALVDGAALTAWRTGAASGAATDLLARRDAVAAAVFGCGAQARTQVLALDAVRRFEKILVYAPEPREVDDFVAEMGPLLQAHLEPAPDSQAAVRDADVVCAATSSSTPVFDGRLVRPGTHVNGIGSFTPTMQELDATLVERAHVFIDSLEAALQEAGDLLIAAAEGRTQPADWTAIGEVILGRRPGRTSPDEITLFKSVGLAVQDVTTAARAVERARRAGLGTLIEL